MWVAEEARDAFVPLAGCAGATQRIGIGAGAALAFVRSPLATALAALDLDDLSGGRLRLGLAAGSPRVVERWHGMPADAPVARMRETVVAVRTFIERIHSGDAIDLAGEHTQHQVRGWRRPFPPRRDTVPILVESIGPAMTQLTGEIGDGWIAPEVSSARSLDQHVLPNLRIGLERSGRSNADLHVVASAICVPRPDGDDARRIAAHALAYYATVAHHAANLDAHGFDREVAEVRGRFAAGDAAGAVDAVTDDMVATLTLAGTPDEVLDRMTAYEGLADVVKLSAPSNGLPAEMIREVQAAILELFA